MIVTGSKRPYELHAGDGFSAIVRPGGRTRESGRLCGDALLIEPGIGFFAVADSPDRSPGASIDFLRRLDAVLPGRIGVARPHRTGGDDAGITPDLLIDLVNRVIRATDYNASTTFTAVLPAVPRPGTLLMMHSGDSELLHIRRETRSVEKISRTNHCFVGKTSAIYQYEDVPYDRDSLFLLATDGILDLFRQASIRDAHCPMPEDILNTIIQTPVPDVPMALLDRYDGTLEQCDDLGLILLDPNPVRYGDTRLG